MDYKQKLIQFNSTEKYKAELNFLTQLLCPKPHERILDYGCGLGRSVWHLRDQYRSEAFGYDINNFRETEDQFVFRNEFHFGFEKVYFMHSLAHIPDLDGLFERIFEWALKPGGNVYVITPNKKWLDLHRNPDYIPDKTVVDHFTIESLLELFVSRGFKIINIGQFGDIKDGINERLYIQARR